MPFRSFVRNCFRCKTVPQDLTQSPLNRCLSLTHVLFYSIGSVIGIGIYALTGQLVHDTTGPATILAFVISGAAMSLTAMCYAEFAARIPRAGSGYIYAYTALGELPAFIAGWNMLFEMLVGLGVAARGTSAYFDQWVNNWITNTTRHLIGDHYLASLSPTWFADIPDLLAVLIIIVFTILVCIGVKEGVTVQSTAIVLNLLVIVFTVCVGLWAGHDVSLWQTQPNNPNGTHPGGFLPFGVSGIMSGTAATVFAYGGFESVGTLAEEAKDPKRVIPISILCTSLIATVCYVLMSLTLTLAIPYTQVDPNSAFVHMFSQNGVFVVNGNSGIENLFSIYKKDLHLNLPWAATIVMIGAGASMLSHMYTNMCAVPRYVYAMAGDAMLFDWFAHVNRRTQVPIRAMLVMSSLTTAIILMFNMKTLVEFTAIGSLTAFTLTAMSSLVLRYRPPNSILADDNRLLETDLLINQSISNYESVVTASVPPLRLEDLQKPSQAPKSSQSRSRSQSTPTTMSPTPSPVDSSSAEMVPFWLQRIFGARHECSNTPTSESIVIVCLLTFIVCFTVVCICIRLHDAMSVGTQVCFYTVPLLLVIVSCALIGCIQQFEQHIDFKVPFSPWLQLACIAVNILFLTFLQALTWLRFAIWLVLGLIIYFGYGYRRSLETK